MRKVELLFPDRGATYRYVVEASTNGTAWETIADRYRGMTVQQLDAEARRYIDIGDFVWVVVGDAARVRPQLEQLGLPIETMEPR